MVDSIIVVKDCVVRVAKYGRKAFVAGDVVQPDSPYFDILDWSDLATDSGQPAQPSPDLPDPLVPVVLPGGINGLASKLAELVGSDNEFATAQHSKVGGLVAGGTYDFMSDPGQWELGKKFDGSPAFPGDDTAVLGIENSTLDARGKILTVTGPESQISIRHKALIPFDSNTLYRVEVQGRCRPGGGSATSQVYIGLAAMGADGKYYSSRNTIGEFNIGWHNFVCAQAERAPSDSGMLTWVGYIRGTVPLTNSATTERVADSPAQAQPVHKSTVWLQPAMLINWEAGNTVFELASFKVDAIPGRVNDELTPGRDLSPFWSNWANRENEPVNIMVMGDSISEGGIVVGDVTLRFQNQLQNRLRKLYQPNGVAGAEMAYIPAWYAVPAGNMDTSRFLTTAGSLTSSVDGFGLGGRYMTVKDGGSVTFNFTGTSAKVAYAAGLSGGVMAVSVDGAPAVTVDTYRAAGTLAGNAFAIPGLSAGAHTVKITRDASTVAGRDVYLEGLHVWNGDEAKGIRTLDASHWGTTAQTQAGSGWYKSILIEKPSLVILALGTNDANFTRAKEDIKNDLRSVMSQIRTLGACDPAFLLVGWPKRSGTVYGKWGLMLEANREIAMEDPKAAFLDFRERAPQMTGTAADYGYYSDGVHPSARGHSWIADVLIQSILPR